MDIYVISAFGTGATPLSAFDKALQKAGVANYNLITLSSIVPKGARIIKANRYRQKTDNEYGYKLYAVKWDIRSGETKKFIASGLGWYQDIDGRGFFVEHDACGYGKKDVEGELLLKIERSIRDLCNFRNIRFNKLKMGYSYSIGSVKSKPACALAIAVYKVEGW